VLLLGAEVISSHRDRFEVVEGFIHCSVLMTGRCSSLPHLAVAVDVSAVVHLVMHLTEASCFTGETSINLLTRQRGRGHHWCVWYTGTIKALSDHSFDCSRLTALLLVMQ